MATVLVVDDDAGVRESLAALVDILGHSCVSAANGRHALMQAHLTPPDLIITDVRMPLMDGYEFLRAIRDDQDPGLAATPALIYTGTESEESDRRALACGVLEVFTKPGEPRRLIAAIRSALERPH